MRNERIAHKELARDLYVVLEKSRERTCLRVGRRTRRAAVDAVSLGFCAFRLVQAGPEHAVAGETSAAHAHVLGAVAAYAGAVVRAALNAAFLKFRSASDRWQQDGGSTLATNAERRVAEADDPRPGSQTLRRADDAGARPEGNAFDPDALKARAQNAGAAVAPATDTVAGRALAHDSIVAGAAAVNPVPDVLMPSRPKPTPLTPPTAWPSRAWTCNP